MTEETLEHIFKKFDKYLIILECPLALEKININNINNAFECSYFVENIISIAKKQGNIINLISHLHEYWKNKNRTKLYSCDELELACDNILQVFMKNSNTPTSAIDKYLTLYIDNLSSQRLNNFLINILTNSLLNNSLIESLINCGIDKNKFDNDIRLAEWENLISLGKYDEFNDCLDEMLNDGYTNEIINYIQLNNISKQLKNSIIKYLKNLTDDNNSNICIAITNSSNKLLSIILDNFDFRISFIDAIFYFGRNMNWNGEIYTCDHGFSYDYLIKIFKKLFNLSDDIIVELVKRRLDLAKVHTNDIIWNKIEDNCVS